MSSKDQSELENRFSEANVEMHLRNMYQKIAWTMQPTNEYLFDQTKGQVKYRVEDTGCEVVAKPKIIGTFNLDDETFLWADKNPSINNLLNDKVDSFRQTLPKEYQKDKFKSDTDLNANLISLFSYHLDANGFDNQIQDRTLIYYSLLEIRVFKDGKEILMLEPKSHVQVVEDQKRIDLIKTFHKEQIEVNRLHSEKKIELEEAFKRIKEVHLKYWLNEDPYFFPGLSWPCNFDENSIIDWKVFNANDNRGFVMYITNLGWAIRSYAFEIDVNAEGRKVIINEY